MEWNRNELAQAAGPQALVERVAELGPQLRRPEQGHHGHGTATESTREASLLTNPITPRQTLDVG